MHSRSIRPKTILITCFADYYQYLRGETMRMKYKNLNDDTTKKNASVSSIQLVGILELCCGKIQKYIHILFLVSICWSFGSFSYVYRHMFHDDTCNLSTSQLSLFRSCIWTFRCWFIYCSLLRTWTAARFQHFNSISIEKVNDNVSNVVLIVMSW